MDLFSVFPKEQMKEILNETWGNFKPVHIASMFLNHEILRELIQVKNEVNLISKNCLTPLSLVVYYSGENKENKIESRMQSLPITEQLLLSNGADINLKKSIRISFTNCKSITSHCTSEYLY